MTNRRNLIKDEKVLFENAKKYSATFPVLYKSILAQYDDVFDNEKKLQIGLEALENIHVEFTIRGEIALIAAKAAHSVSKYDI